MSYRFFASLAGVLLAARILAAAPAPEVRAPYAQLIDYDTGHVLFEKNADQPAQPGSLVHLLAIYRAFELVRAGALKLDQEIIVTPEMGRRIKNTYAQSGSALFLDTYDRVRVSDLVRAMIVAQSNDAAIVLAIAAGTSEINFADDLNALAERLGMEGTNLANPVGWIEKSNSLPAGDIAVLSRRLISDFPEYYGYFSEKEFSLRKDNPNKDNSNKLLWIMASSDGLKASASTRSGYGLAASAKKGPRRLIVVINGLKGANPSYNRFIEAKRLLDWGFREFSNYVYFRPGDTVVEIPVWFGNRRSVKAGVSRPVVLTSPRGSEPDIRMRLEYSSPLRAPVRKGDAVGRLVLSPDGGEYDLVANGAVGESGFMRNIIQNIRQFMSRMVR
ncbi:MAG: D-alanyl-D-alanine carboxypeptidase [Rickettsiales bacterium]|jgi:D-alanyl-D-alanine carboxypeptidase (penicillin-binding protein 5/6)|nr:D-alanyl-D-alanine carboxypeptidase [Rickettsiales bacterium]